jgi:hypothetical protein
VEVHWFELISNLRDQFCRFRNKPIVVQLHDVTEHNVHLTISSVI